MDKIKIHPIKLGALPIIHELAQKLDLLKTIEIHVPQDARETIPASQTLYAILCNVILERFPLYKIGEWSAERGLFPVKLAECLNDDRIGRALHRLFNADRATLLTQIVLKAIQQFGLNTDRIHNDSTSVTLFGQYDIKHKASKPKHGYNKDHRPDLKQLIFSLTVCGDGAVPIYFKVWDGNITDDRTHLRNWMSLRNLLGKSDFIYIADCKLCTKESMEFIDSEHGKFITVLPETRAENHKFKEWIQANAPPWVEAMRQPGKRKNDPDSVYWVFDSPFLSIEGFRIIWVLSSDKQRLDEHKRKIFIEKTIAAFKELEKTQYKSRTKLKKHVHEIFSENKNEKYFHWQITTQIQSSYKQIKRGRPTPKTPFRKVDKVLYTLSWSHNQEQIRYDAKCDGLFPLITNTKELALNVLESYKYQPYLEKRHEQLKSVYDVAPVFLKHPERIEALLFIYFLGMLITALIERRVRKSMQEEEIPSIPIYPEKRLCKKPTADKILDLFRDIRLQTVINNGKVLDIVADEFIVQHENGRVVLLEIPAAMTLPTAFDNIAYIRIGSATPKLVDHPDYHKKLIEALRPYMWEQGIAKQYVTGDEVLRLLDYSSYFRLNKQPLPDNRSGIFEKLAADQLIVRDVADKWNITNLGAILFAVDLNQFGSALARKGVRIVAYDGCNKASSVTHRNDSIKGYAVAFESLVEFINNILPANEHIGNALRVEQPLFPKLAVRELMANALIHQDMTITGTGPQVELFKDRIEITNPGKSLLQPDRMIDLPPRSRNEMMASLMRRMGFCEEQGSGLDKVIMDLEIFQLPPLFLREAESSMQVILYAPRTFANMTPDERIRACYQHAILKWLSGDRMKNLTLCGRFGIEKHNAAQATKVITQAQKEGLIKPADPEHPRAGYVPYWA